MTSPYDIDRMSLYVKLTIADSHEALINKTNMHNKDTRAVYLSAYIAM